MTGKHKIIAIIMTFLLANSLIAGTCDEYIKDYGTTSGVVPNIKDGQIDSFSIFGEGTFIAPKSSLISTARRQAEMKAKRDFSEWIQQKVAAGSLDEALTESIEQTNADQTTTGSADEIKRYSEYIGSNTESVLSGIIKLDECVDVNKNVIYVRMGWKPKLSEMAADTRATIDNSVARGKSGVMSDSNSGSSTSSAVKVQPIQGYRAKSKLANDF